MKEFFKDVKSDKLTYRVFIATLFFTLLPLPYILFFYRNLPPYLPVFNQLPWGQPRLASPWGVFIPSLISLCILIVNVILSSVLYKKTPLVSRMLAVISFIIALLSLLFVFRTIQIVL
ncbi:MAG: hypothetical protein M1444_03100 [Patescibacteria group bacterium]|nr:hypothetical protein [Patescibacteria group bacterium]